YESRARKLRLTKHGPGQTHVGKLQTAEVLPNQDGPFFGIRQGHGEFLFHRLAPFEGGVTCISCEILSGLLRTELSAWPLQGEMSLVGQQPFSVSSPGGDDFCGLPERVAGKSAAGR